MELADRDPERYIIFLFILSVIKIDNVALYLLLIFLYGNNIGKYFIFTGEINNNIIK